jgi:uncharacterized protein YdiU (UPF0061 family)
MSDWRALYSAILQMQEHHALKRQPVRDAQEAIFQRSKELQHVVNCEEERKEMVEAITVLKFLLRRVGSQQLNTVRAISKKRPSVLITKAI